MTTTVKVESVGEAVLMSIADEVHVQLSTREAFELVTNLLREIDAARGYGEAKRGEVPNPRYNSQYTQRPKGKTANG